MATKEIITYPPTSEEFLTKKNFACTKCGQCCRPIVKVSEKDILRIEKTGRSRDDFLAFDPTLDGPITKNTIKDTLQQMNGVCMFLSRKGQEYLCTIYEHRPDVCRKYPFFTGKEKLTDCRPPRWKYWMEL
ncbi:YkgJ family cysteine cluster protein, partial [Candidatus Woesearchaeota archaeon]|nr:YkgJ family cysteine cluster protein [Candidatus Woesearchaeota archaeon]